MQAKESLTENISILFQKHPSIGVLIKRLSENMQQIYRRTPMSKCDFNKVAKQLCSLVNLQHFSEHLFLRTPLECGVCSQ